MLAIAESMALNTPDPGTPPQRQAGPAVGRVRIGRGSKLGAVRLPETWDDGEDAYVYADNDPGALREAIVLAELLREQGRTPTRVRSGSDVSGPLHVPVRRGAGR